MSTSNAIRHSSGRSEP